MIKILILLFFPVLAFADVSDPAPFPVFLKPGFSSVLEFDDTPIRVVLGDAQSFQVEKLSDSIVVRTLTEEAESNLFVYFKNSDPKLFVLRASPKAEPTYFKKFQKPITLPKQSAQKALGRSQSLKRATRLLKSQFDPKKDYLSLDILFSADSSAEVKPKWDEIRLKYQNDMIKPYKLWAERKEAQRDSQIRARFIFVKPAVPKSLENVALHIPLYDSKEPVLLQLRGGRK